MFGPLRGLLSAPTGLKDTHSIPPRSQTPMGLIPGEAPPKDFDGSGDGPLPPAVHTLVGIGTPESAKSFHVKQAGYRTACGSPIAFRCVSLDVVALAKGSSCAPRRRE